MNRFEFVSSVAAKPSRSWTHREVLYFHYFNPNGLYAQKKAVDVEIDKLVEEGLAKFGAIVAYGSLDSYHLNQLRNLVDKKRVGCIELSVALDGLRSRIKTAKEFVTEKRN